MNGTTAPAPVGEEIAHFPRATPCRDHAFDDALVCRCGVSWSSHQRSRKSCPLNARGRNRGEEAARRPRGHA